MNLILKNAKTLIAYLYVNHTVITILIVIFCTQCCSLEFLVHWTAIFESLFFQTTKIT